MVCLTWPQLKLKRETIPTTQPSLSTKIQPLNTPVEAPILDRTMSAAFPSIANSQLTSSDSGDYTPQANEAEATRYANMSDDVKTQTRRLFAVVAAPWVRDVMPNIIAKKVEGVDYATHAEVYTQSDQ